MYLDDNDKTLLFLLTYCSLFVTTQDNDLT